MLFWTRIRNHYRRKGYNIQSPFVFFLVRYVLFGKERYYAYDDVRLLLSIRERTILRKISLVSQLLGYYRFSHVVHFGFGSLWHILLMERMLPNRVLQWYVPFSQKEKAIVFLQTYHLSKVSLLALPEKESFPSEFFLQPHFIFLSEDGFPLPDFSELDFSDHDFFIWSESSADQNSASVCLHFGISSLLIYKREIFNKINVTFEI